MPKSLTASCKKFPVLADPVNPVAARALQLEDLLEEEAAAEPEPAAQVRIVLYFAVLNCAVLAGFCPAGGSSGWFQAEADVHQD